MNLIVHQEYQKYQGYQKYQKLSPSPFRAGRKEALLDRGERVMVRSGVLEKRHWGI